MVLRKKIDPKGDRVIRGLRRLHKEELPDI
jgi:hypothetical protein